jgi:hypothetical protein
MKPIPILSTLLVLVAAGSAVRADPKSPPPVLYTATVKDATAEVRCGPSTDPKMYATNTLKQNQPVQVLKELPDGWLAIKPPPGSFSWINTRFLQRVSPQSIYWVVITHDDAPVPVRIGSELTDSKPTVEGAHLVRGTSVVAIGRELADPEEGIWLPIEPPEGELRYIRAQAVVRTQPTTTTAAASPVAPPPITPVDSGFSTPAPLPPPPAAPGTTTAAQSAPPPPAAPGAPAATAAGSPEEMWQKAEEMEQSGRPADAERMYVELGDKVKNDPAKHDLWMRCLNRLHFLRTAARTATAAATTMTRPTESHYGSPVADTRIQPVPANPAPPGPAPGQPQQAYTGYTPTQGPAQATTVMGRLRTTGRSAPGDSRRLYMLERSDGYPIAYVLPGTGVDLESYVTRNVELSGTWVYNGELRANCLTATRLTLLP